MKHRLPIFAIMAVSSQLALADAANDPVFEPAGDANDSKQLVQAEMATELDQDWGESTSHPELADISADIEQELQDKLDNSLQFDLPPRTPTDPEFAGTH